MLHPKHKEWVEVVSCLLFLPKDAIPVSLTVDDVTNLYLTVGECYCGVDNR